MKRDNAEKLRVAAGVIKGIAHSLPKYEEEVKQALHAVSLVITNALRDEEENNEQRKAD